MSQSTRSLALSLVSPRLLVLLLRLLPESLLVDLGRCCASLSLRLLRLHADGGVSVALLGSLERDLLGVGPVAVVAVDFEPIMSLSA